MLTIELSGCEPPHVIAAAQAALRAWAFTFEEAVGEQPAWIRDALPPDPDPAPPAPAAAIAEAPATEAPKPSASQRKRKAAQQEVPADSADTAPADMSAALGEAVIANAANAEVREVKLEEIRAIAAKFNTDALRELAMEILGRYGVQSVSALIQMDNGVRLAALNEFQTVYTQQVKEAA
jgi:hypothetical protein